jgi:hypothetical protein
MSTPTKGNTLEQRRKRRVPIADYLEVTDTHSGKILGQLVNLSVDGLMLMGPCCITPGTIYQLTIPLQTDPGAEPLLVGAESLWCHDANESGSYWSGFQIIDVAPQHREILTGIVDG